MYHMVPFFTVFLLVSSASVWSQVEECANDGELCTYGEYCCSSYCDYYHRSSADDLGTCSPPPPNWGNCSFDGDDCANNGTCCSGYCYNSSYCTPLFFPVPPVSNEPTLAPASTPVSAASPPSTMDHGSPAPTPLPSNGSPSPRHSKIRHIPAPSAPTPCN